MEILARMESFLAKILAHFSKVGHEVAKWYRTPNHDELRLEYNLNQSSVVFDLGGYHGQWASDIFSKYCCYVYVFEPVTSFARKIEKRFSKNNRIKTFQFGLAEKNYEDFISVDEASSSTFKSGSALEKVRFEKIDDFLKERQIEGIDLMKINIEGGEYSLLEHLIETGLIKKIKNIQVQFHDFVPNAEKRMAFIQDELSRTHHLTYQFKFVWENWELTK